MYWENSDLQAGIWFGGVALSPIITFPHFTMVQLCFPKNVIFSAHVHMCNAGYVSLDSWWDFWFVVTCAGAFTTKNNRSRWPISVDVDYALWVVSILFGYIIFFWWCCPSMESGFVYFKKVGHQPERAFTTNRWWSSILKTSIKKSNLFFDSTSVFVKNFGLKIIEELNIDHFRNLHK